MPADAWLLLITSVGLGLGIELVYMAARQRERRARRSGDEGSLGERRP